MTTTLQNTDRCAKRSRSQAGKSWQKLYKTKRWLRLRARQLKRHPMCQCQHCREQELLATVVDHKKKHNGDRRLFFDPANLQSMAKQCHDSFKQSEERGGAGFLKGCDEQGFPLSQEHDWYSRDPQS